jgi:hypothetical protein
MFFTETMQKIIYYRWAIGITKEIMDPNTPESRIKEITKKLPTWKQAYGSSCTNQFMNAITERRLS